MNSVTQNFTRILAGVLHEITDVDQIADPNIFSKWCVLQEESSPTSGALSIRFRINQPLPPDQRRPSELSQIIQAEVETANSQFVRRLQDLLGIRVIVDSSVFDFSLVGAALSFLLSLEAWQMGLFLGGIVLLGVSAYVYMSQKYPLANNSILLVAGFGLADMATDGVFVGSLAGHERYRTEWWLGLAFLAGPALINFILVVWVLASETGKVG